MLKWVLLVCALVCSLGLAYTVGYGSRTREYDKVYQATTLAFKEVADADRASALAAQKADYDGLIASLIKRAGERKDQAVKISTIIREIHDAPRTTNCASSPAIRHALDSLRALSAAPGAAGTDHVPG